jgi:hypothetical protein
LNLWGWFVVVVVVVGCCGGDVTSDGDGDGRRVSVSVV